MTAIIVSGSVTAKQYEQVRLEALRKGLKPEIVRDPYIIGYMELWLQSCKDPDMFLNDEVIDDEFENFETPVDRFIREHDGIYAIIVPEKDEEAMMIETYLPWLIRILDKRSQEYYYWHALEDGTAICKN